MKLGSANARNCHYPIMDHAYNKLYFLKKEDKNAARIPMPRCVFMLAYLAVPVKFLFSLHLIHHVTDRKTSGHN